MSSADTLTETTLNFFLKSSKAITSNLIQTSHTSADVNSLVLIHVAVVVAAVKATAAKATASTLEAFGIEATTAAASAIGAHSRLRLALNSGSSGAPSFVARSSAIATLWGGSAACGAEATARIPGLCRAGVLAAEATTSEAGLYRAGVLTAKSADTEPGLYRAGVLAAKSAAAEAGLCRAGVLAAEATTSEAGLYRAGVLTAKATAAIPGLCRLAVLVAIRTAAWPGLCRSALLIGSVAFFHDICNLAGAKAAVVCVVAAVFIAVNSRLILGERFSLLLAIEATLFWCTER